MDQTFETPELPEEIGPFFECLLCNKPMKQLHIHMKSIHGLETDKFGNHYREVTLEIFEELREKFYAQFTCNFCDYPFHSRY